MACIYIAIVYMQSIANREAFEIRMSKELFLFFSLKVNLLPCGGKRGRQKIAVKLIVEST